MSAGVSQQLFANKLNISHMKECQRLQIPSLKWPEMNAGLKKPGFGSFKPLGNRTCYEPVLL